MYVCVCVSVRECECVSVHECVCACESVCVRVCECVCGWATVDSPGCAEPGPQ